MSAKHVCAGCAQPLGAMKVTLSTPQGWQTYCGVCGRSEWERRAKEKVDAAIAEHVMYPNAEE